MGDLTWLDHEQATVSAVLDALSQYNIVHLACHGVQDAVDATRSAFILFDGRLTLHDLMAKSLTDVELAVLSACQTATGDTGLPEEAVHLAAGMLSVGYRNVIGTMWSIGDNEAPIVAGVLYSKLLEYQDTGMDWRDGIAYALHHAIQGLREEVKEESFAKWVPFIHFGV
ncbi:hypothetical protein BT96DRAFT_852964 [Gymnopus androsaceus JB14]|uniref:CHAT domain-containing protein n=1 Tax=Gymnopus androsaceus JB14 TaxID=1447944 RepID=A0A6A4I4A5_9AGAR|nr:hypothetical protein BT96DRAFT_852964 [Gymnopus androsaceus JB14]